MKGERDIQAKILGTVLKNLKMGRLRANLSNDRSFLIGNSKDKRIRLCSVVPGDSMSSSGTH